jgi:hypothetical protein
VEKKAQNIHYLCGTKQKSTLSKNKKTINQNSITIIGTAHSSFPHRHAIRKLQNEHQSIRYNNPRHYILIAIVLDLPSDLELAGGARDSSTIQHLQKMRSPERLSASILTWRQLKETTRRVVVSQTPPMDPQRKHQSVTLSGGLRTKQLRLAGAQVQERAHPTKATKSSRLAGAHRRGSTA